jgi:hypothetical protein
MVYNSTGSDLDRFAVVAIQSVMYGPDDNLSEFTNNAAFMCTTPGAGDEGRFAILQAPCAQDKWAPALFSGVTPVKIQFKDHDDRCADILPGETDKLGSVIMAGVDTDLMRVDSGRPASRGARGTSVPEFSLPWRALTTSSSSMPTPRSISWKSSGPTCWSRAARPARSPVGNSSPVTAAGLCGRPPYPECRLRCESKA